MKGTDEERTIIRFLKKEMKDAQYFDIITRNELIQALQKGPCSELDFENYNNARETYFTLSGLYDCYVDEIATRFKHEIRFGKS